MCAASRALLFARRDALDALIETTERDSTESGEVAAVRFWRVTRDVAFDLPCALFLTAYALLVLFWAEIYLRARGATRTTTPRRTFFLANFILYAALAAVWTAGAFARGEAARRRLEACATLVVASFAFILAASFARYGGCLFQMLRRFPPPVQRAPTEAARGGRGHGDVRAVLHPEGGGGVGGRGDATDANKKQWREWKWG